MISSTAGSIVVVPLSAPDITTANVHDNHVYPDLTLSCLHAKTIKKTHYMITNPGYNDRNIYELSINTGFQLVCSVRRYKTTSKERLQLVVDFYVSIRAGDIFKEKHIHRTTD